jgi:hypothetical protein
MQIPLPCTFPQPTTTMTFFYAVSSDSARREVLLYNNIKYCNYYVLTTKWFQFQFLYNHLNIYV